MATDRTMSTTWRGTLMEGSGTIHEAGSGAFGPLDVTWASRAEEPDGKTSPEELLAAAHSACFSMALSLALARAGTPADQLDTSSTVTFVPGTGITKIAVTVRGSVTGIDEAAFVAAAEGAKVGCPVSKALAGVPEMTLDASLVPAPG
jgi:lipoyl-dependent peroxiredoxin